MKSGADFHNHNLLILPQCRFVPLLKTIFFQYLTLKHLVELVLQNTSYPKDNVFVVFLYFMRQ